MKRKPEPVGTAGADLSPPETRRVAISNRHPRLAFDRAALIRAVRLLDDHHDVLAAAQAPRFPGELSIVFMSDRALARLHADFLADPTTTDVITFAGDPAHGIGGEICVSVDTAAHYAREHGREFGDELMLYVVHGWLHLAGHDDLAPARKRVMRRAEQRAMKLLTRPGCLPRMILRRGGRR